MIPVEIAKKKEQERQDRGLCIRNGICPECGSEMTDTWTETQRLWFGRTKEVVLSPDTRSEYDPFDYYKCVPCGDVYVV